jgi:hypothetical protein
MIKSTKTRLAAGAGAVIAVLGFAATVALSNAAQAFVGFSVGIPFGFPFYYPPPPPVPAFYPPPAYYPPPGPYPPPASSPSPGGYTPSAVRQAPPITYTPRRPWTDASGRQCREYQTSRDAQGRPTKVYGTACRDPDGQWRIVN